MKRIITVLISLLCAIGIRSMAACEYHSDITVYVVIREAEEFYYPDFEYEGLYYNILSEENAEVRVMPPVNIEVMVGFYDCGDCPREWDYRHDLPAEGFYSGDIVIPEKVEHEGKFYTVTTIAPCTFGNCVNLTSVKLPETLREIQNAAFDGCTSLKELILPESTKIMRLDAMDRCDSLVSFDMAYLVNFDGWWMVGPKSLKTITVSQAVDADFACVLPASLESIIQPNENPKIPENAIYLTHKNPELYETVVVYVPSGSEEAYRTDDFWGQFKNIKTIGNSGVANVETNTWSLAIENGRITLRGDASLEVYSLLGNKVATMSANNNCVSLPAGIYVCLSDGKAEKIIVK